MRNSIAFGDLHTLAECPKAYQFRSAGTPRVAPHIAEVTGDITHAALAVLPESRKAIIETALSRLPEKDRPEVSRAVQAMVRAGDAMDEGDLDKENKIRYLDPMTGWQLVAKPDQMGMVNEGGRPIFQIVDVKTGGHLKRKHKKQIFFFGLVACLSMPDYRGPIKLVVRLLGENQDVVFWFSRARLDESLAAVRQAIRQIETARAERNFPARVGWACGSCCFRERCTAYQSQTADKTAACNGGTNPPATAIA